MSSSGGRGDLARAVLVFGALSVVLLVAACGGGSAAPAESSSSPAQPSSSLAPASSSPAQQSSSAIAGAVYSTQAFGQSFDVAQPTWLAPAGMPNVDQSNFLTWESPDGSRAVRFMLPSAVYEPGAAAATPPPVDYLAYLMGQDTKGVQFTDQAPVTVDGQAGSIFTATTDKNLDGSFGCPDPKMTAGDCFGFQTDLILRMAVVDVSDHPMVAWMRNSRTSNPDDVRNDQKSFADMLASVRFTDRAPSSAASTSAASTTPIDGAWEAGWTREELVKSPLLMDPGEVNDENWGTLTMTFNAGAATETISNPKGEITGHFAYQVDGDAVTFQHDNGERFVMRWAIKGDQLTLTRDESLGVGPTPYVIKPFTRQS